jgi:hypothetical protein
MSARFVHCPYPTPPPVFPTPESLELFPALAQVWGNGEWKTLRHDSDKKTTTGGVGWAADHPFSRAISKAISRFLFLLQVIG